MVSVRPLLSLHLMLQFELCRAGSPERQTDEGGERASWTPCAQTRTTRMETQTHAGSHTSDLDEVGVLKEKLDQTIMGPNAPLAQDSKMLKRDPWKGGPTRTW